MSGCSTPTKTLIAEEADIIKTEPHPHASILWNVNTEGGVCSLVMVLCRLSINMWGTVSNCNNSHFYFGLSVLMLFVKTQP